MKNVIITGANGFIGSHLIEYILENHPEYMIHGMKRHFRSDMSNVDHIDDKRLKWEVADLTDAHAVETMIKKRRYEKCFHLAAQSYVPDSFTNPAATINANIIGTLNLLEAFRKHNKDTIIHIASSSESYGQPTKKDLPIKETCPFRPQSPYGVSKAGTDLLSRQYFDTYGLKTIRTRMFTQTGPRRGAVFFVSAFAKQVAMIEKGMQKPVIKVGNVDSMRTIMDVRDAVRAYWILTEKCPPGEVYNVAGDTTVKVGDVAKKLAKMSTVKNIKIKIDKRLLRPSDVTLQIPSCAKFKKQTGWKPRIPLEQTLQDTLDYWRMKLPITFTEYGSYLRKKLKNDTRQKRKK